MKEEALRSEKHIVKKAIFSTEIRKKVQKLQKRNNWYNFFAISYDWLIIAGGIYLAKAYPSWWMYLISLCLIGSRMRAFDNLMHEASHILLFENRNLNKWMACFFVAFPVFTSYTTYCKSHYMHHKHLWDPEHDPDTKRYALIGLDKPQDSIKQFLFRHILKPLTLTHVPFAFHPRGLAELNP